MSSESLLASPRLPTPIRLIARSVALPEKPVGLPIPPKAGSVPETMLGARAGIVLAIDPGPTESAYVVYHGEAKTVHEHGKVDNAKMLEIVRNSRADSCVIEMIGSYGMSVGREVFETCVFIGRLMEVWRIPSPQIPASRMYRRTVKLHLCNSMKAKDGNIRQVLLDRWGGKAKAMGCKASPGPLYGFAKDQWAALAIAVSYADGVQLV